MTKNLPFVKLNGLDAQYEHFFFTRSLIKPQSDSRSSRLQTSIKLRGNRVITAARIDNVFVEKFYFQNYRKKHYNI